MKKVVYKPFTRMEQLQDGARVRISICGCSELSAVLRYAKTICGRRNVPYWVFCLPRTSSHGWSLSADWSPEVRRLETPDLKRGWRVPVKDTLAAQLHTLASESVELRGIAPPVRILPNGIEVQDTWTQSHSRATR